MVHNNRCLRKFQILVYTKYGYDNINDHVGGKFATEPVCNTNHYQLMHVGKIGHFNYPYKGRIHIVLMPHACIWIVSAKRVYFQYPTV